MKPNYWQEYFRKERNERQKHRHDPNCSGCPHCSRSLRAAHAAFVKDDGFETYCKWLRHLDEQLRSTAQRGELRTNIVYQQENETMSETPIPVPNPYAAALAQMRAAATNAEPTPGERFARELRRAASR